MMKNSTVWVLAFVSFVVGQLSMVLLSSALDAGKRPVVRQQAPPPSPLKRPPKVATPKRKRAIDGKYKVQGIDSLWNIAKREYGNGNKWTWIYAANKGKIRNPNVIKSGQVLVIPKTKPKMKAFSRAPKGFRYWKTVDAKLTAYTPSWKSCAPFADGKTSIGKNAWNMNGCATAPRAIPYGTMVDIPGIGVRIVDDTGRSMRSSWRKGEYHVDVRFRSHARAKRFGVKTARIVLYVRDDTRLAMKED